MQATSAAWARALWCTRSEFLVLGFLAGLWGAHVPSVKVHYALTDRSLSLVLFAVAAGAVVSLFGAGPIVKRVGARHTCATAAVLMSAALGSFLEYPGLASLLVASFVLGVSMSMLDIAINTEGSELESRGGRPLMSNLHAMFSLGGMAGAITASVLFTVGMTARAQLPGVCVIAALAGFVASRGMLETHAIAADTRDGRSFVWPTGKLLVIGCLLFAGMLAEGAMYDWSVLYLKESVGMPQGSAVLGYAVFATAMAVARFGGDFLRSRYNELSLVRHGATAAAVAMAICLFLQTPWAAFVGFAIVGVGLAFSAPILMNAASRVHGASRAAGLAAVTAFGYFGFMIGPPLVGEIATAVSLRVALGVVVIASAVLAIGALSIAGNETRARAT